MVICVEIAKAQVTIEIHSNRLLRHVVKYTS